jgi:hypothetical protein
MPAIKAATCRVVAQAILKGTQHMTVRYFGRVDGWTTPYITIKIGQILLNIEDRDALRSLGAAIRQAEQHADAAFGIRWMPAA